VRALAVGALVVVLVASCGAAPQHQARTRGSAVPPPTPASHSRSHVSVGPKTNGTDVHLGPPGGPLFASIDVDVCDVINRRYGLAAISTAVGVRIDAFDDVAISSTGNDSQRSPTFCQWASGSLNEFFISRASSTMTFVNKDTPANTPVPSPAEQEAGCTGKTLPESRDGEKLMLDTGPDYGSVLCVLYNNVFVIFHVELDRLATKPDLVRDEQALQRLYTLVTS
jgi:hypothetical protein